MRLKEGGIKKHPYAVVHTEWYSKLHVQGQQITTWKPVYCFTTALIHTHSPRLSLPFAWKHTWPQLGAIYDVYPYWMWAIALIFFLCCCKSICKMRQTNEHFCCITLTKLKWMSCNLKHDCELLNKQVSPQEDCWARLCPAFTAMVYSCVTDDLSRSPACPLRYVIYKPKWMSFAPVFFTVYK